MSDDPNSNNLATGAPLPWHAEKFTYDCYPFIEEEWEIKDAQGETIVKLTPNQEDTSFLPTELRARLWAAAPELAEAVCDAIVYLIAWDSDDLELRQHVLDKLNKAYLKATGRDILAEATGRAPIPWHCEDCGAAWEASLSEFPDKAHCPKCQSVHIY